MTVINNRVDVGDDNSPAGAYKLSRRPANPGQSRLRIVPLRRQSRCADNKPIHSVKLLLHQPVWLPGVHAQKLGMSRQFLRNFNQKQMLAGNFVQHSTAHEFGDVFGLFDIDLLFQLNDNLSACSKDLRHSQQHDNEN